MKDIEVHKRTAPMLRIDVNTTNMLYLDPWYNFIQEYIIKDNPIVAVKDESEVEFAAINTVAYFITKAITTVLANYCKTANIPKDYWHLINMKNEFLFSRLILTDKKKRYISSVVLREGKLISPEKVDIKGHDFMKSSTREDTKKFFTQLCKEHLLVGDISVPTILKKIDKFQLEIRDSIENSEKKFLIPKSVKELEAYKEPFGQQQVKASIIWNELEPANPIQFPDKIDIVKVSIKKLEDADIIKESHPKVYKGIEKIFTNEDLKNKVAKKGIEVIAIPSNIETIPDWLKIFINYDVIINDNISRFQSALRALRVDVVKVSGRTNFSNIVTI